jgi:phage shock protein PspC (stress-responsive transcriptional regulator)
MNNETKRLYRSRDERMIGGVASGLGMYLGLDPTIVRLIFVVLQLAFPGTLLAYLILLLVVPEEPLG